MSGDLQHYLPEASTGYILSWFQQNPVQLRITRSRTSKYGDYRGPVKKLPARISVNHNLGPYEFLITLVHEMAHHAVYDEHQRRQGAGLFTRRSPRPRPHGKEWKRKYRELMKPLLNESVFPPAILGPLALHLLNPQASAGASKELSVALQPHAPDDGAEFISELPENALFRIPGGRVFMKKEKIRTRYRCIRVDNRRIYLFSPAARVTRLEPPKPLQYKLEF